MVENPTYLNIDFIPKDPFFWSTTESASEFFADRPTAGLPHISGWCQIRDDSIALGSHFHPMFFFHDPSIDENGMKWLDLILLSMTPILVPSFHPSIDTKSYWILGPISSELYQLYQRLMWRTRGFRRVWPQNCVPHVSINGVSPCLSIVLTFILTIGRKPTGHPKFWMAKEPVSYYVFICIYHNVGNSQCHEHHPLLSPQIYIYIGGMVTIPGHEWFLALLPYILPYLSSIFSISSISSNVLPTFTNIYGIKNHSQSWVVRTTGPQEPEAKCPGQSPGPSETDVPEKEKILVAVFSLG